MLICTGSKLKLPEVWRESKDVNKDLVGKKKRTETQSWELDEKNLKR